MTYPIYIYGSPVLRAAVTDASPEQVTPQLISDMFETLRAANGVGLAAPQIGLALNLFVIDLSPLAEDHPELADMRRVMVNPEIYHSSDDAHSDEEGCLSLPGIHENVSRPITIRIRYRDRNWEERDEEYSGYPARVIQHEYDHLRGTVFTDRITPIRKTMVAGKLSSMSKGKYRASYKTRRS